MKKTILQVGVKIFLKNSEGKYLLQRRNPEKYPEVGPKWCIVGGRIDPGSSLIDNLRREIKEETNFDYDGAPVLIAAQDILRNEGQHVVRLTYTGEINGVPKLSEESLEYRWFELDELKKLTRKELDIYFKDLLDQGLFD